MTGHLSEEQISALLADETPSASIAHLASCEHCRQRVEQFRDVMAAFRGAARNWGDRQRGACVAADSRPRIGAMAIPCAIALLLLVAVISYRFSAKPSSHPAQRAATGSSMVAVDPDAVLLRQVSEDVSRSTPSGMETLLGFTATRTTQR